MITLVACGGLGNRMRAMNSAAGLAERTGHQLRVVWEKDPSLACRFRELFIPPGKIEVIETIPYDRAYFWRLDLWIYRPRENCRPSFKKIIGLIQDRRFDLVWSYNDVEFIMKAGWDFDSIRRSREVLLFSGNEFLEGPFGRDLFVPVSEIAERVCEVRGRFGPNTIGVHIRRQDHTWAIDQSPEQMFVDRMEELVAEDDRASFFLATDCPETEQRMRERFPGRILTSEPERSRSTWAGMRDAVVDMYCLAQTSHILGSYWSTFSEMASRLGGVSLEIIKRIDHD